MHWRKDVPKFVAAGFIVHIVFVACSADRDGANAMDRLVDAGMDVVMSAIPDAARPFLDGGNSDSSRAIADGPFFHDASRTRDGALIRDAYAQDAAGSCQCVSPADSPERAVGGAAFAESVNLQVELGSGPFFLTDATISTAFLGTVNAHVYLVDATVACSEPATATLFNLLANGNTSTTSFAGARYFVPAGKKACAYIPYNGMFAWAGFRAG